MTFSASKEDRLRGHYQDNGPQTFGGRRTLPIFKTLTVGAVFLGMIGGVGWYWMGRTPALQGGDVPLVKAQPGPIKIHPDDHQQMVKQEMIYERLDKVVSNEPQVEHILPPPETPLSRTVNAESAPLQVNSVEDSAQNVQLAETEVETEAGPVSEIDRLSHKYGTDDSEADVLKPVNVSAVAKTPTTPSAEKPTPEMVSIDDIFTQAEGEMPAGADVPDVSNVADQVDVAPPKDNFTLQLGSFPQKAQAEAEKKRVVRALGGAHPVNIQKTDKGIYRLAAGSFSTREEANKKCTALKAKKVDCMVVKRSKP